MVEHDVITWPGSETADFQVDELRRFLSEIASDGWRITAVVPAPGEVQQLLLFVTRES